MPLPSVPPRIMLVGEAWGEQEAAAGQPFVGPAGQVLNGMLRAAGIVRDECFVTNVFNLRPQDNKLKYLGGPKAEAIPGYPQLSSGVWINRQYQPELDRLYEEVNAFQPTIIVCLGATALWAFGRESKITKYRGTPLLDTTGKWKLLPTYHPSAVMRQWKLRPIVIADLQKAKRHAAIKGLHRPTRYIHVEPTLEDLDSFYDKYIAPAETVSCDIETKSVVHNGKRLHTITEVGFSPTPERALVVPFYHRAQTDGNYWRTLDEELAAWDFVRRVAAEKPLYGQNFNYDIQYLWHEMGIPIPRVAGDTMILHHALLPEMEKGLGFLGSIYTDEPSWKFMRQAKETENKQGDD